jgi:hypothetical protein
MSSKTVEMKSSIHGAGERGQVVELDGKWADTLIKKGHAVPVKDEPKPAEEAVADDPAEGEMVEVPSDLGEFA